MLCRGGVGRDWPTLAWWLIDKCIINSYTLWHLDMRAEIGQLDFRRALLQQIRLAYPPPSIPLHPVPPSSIATTAGGHWPKRSGNNRDCRQCSRGRSGRVRSNCVCECCEVHLCIDPCFKLYHEAL